MQNGSLKRIRKDVCPKNIVLNIGSMLQYINQDFKQKLWSTHWDFKKYGIKNPVLRCSLQWSPSFSVDWELSPLLSRSESRKYSYTTLAFLVQN